MSSLTYREHAKWSQLPGMHIAQTGDHPWAPALSYRIPANGPCHSEAPKTPRLNDREVVEQMVKLTFRPRGLAKQLDWKRILMR